MLPLKTISCVDIATVASELSDLILMQIEIESIGLQDKEPFRLGILG